MHSDRLITTERGTERPFVNFVQLAHRGREKRKERSNCSLSKLNRKYGQRKSQASTESVTGEGKTFVTLGIEPMP